jgi:hypothetical protein
MRGRCPRCGAVDSSPGSSYVLAMRRMLLTLPDARCPFGCQYCFAEFSQYERPLDLDAVERSPDLLADVDVVYPACDVDLFATKTPLEILRRTAALGRSISVSTKAALSDRLVRGLADIARDIEERGEILKVGVSISTKHNCGRLEPRAATYALRIRNLRLLQAASIPSALVLKPVLRDVSLGEYCEIISDAEPFTRLVLVGDEYLDALEPRVPLAAVTRRRVPWAINQPIWPVTTDVERIASIKAFAERLGFCVFESDLELMAALAQIRIDEQSLSPV